MRAFGMKRRLCLMALISVVAITKCFFEGSTLLPEPIQSRVFMLSGTTLRRAEITVLH